jgi:hypothetical protein
LYRANFSSPTDNLAGFDQNGLPIQSAGPVDSTQAHFRPDSVCSQIGLVNGDGASSIAAKEFVCQLTFEIGQRVLVAAVENQSRLKFAPVSFL